MDPKAAKDSNSFFLCGAIRLKPECNSSAVKYMRTMVSDTTHRDNCQSLQSHRYGIDIKAGTSFGVSFNDKLEDLGPPEACSINPNPANFDLASFRISQCFCESSNRGGRRIDM